MTPRTHSIFLPILLALSSSILGAALLLPFSAFAHSKSVPVAKAQVQVLTIHFLSFDNHSDDIDINISPLYRAVVETILEATRTAPNTTAALVVDLDGIGDSHVVIIRNGAVERVLGASTLNELLAEKFAGWNLAQTPEPRLPNASGNLSTPSIFEYYMTDANTLGGILRWLFNTYVQDAETTHTLVSYIGHGVGVVPDAELSNILGASYCNGSAPFGVIKANGIIALPSSRGAHPAFTDCHGVFDASAEKYRPTLLAPRSLANALRTAFANSPVKQIDVLDLFHCFALSLEALVEFAPNGVPLAKMVIGSPNYTFFAPEMTGAPVAENERTVFSQEWAGAIIKRYDTILRAGLSTPEESTYYPRLLVAVDGAKIGTMADRLNQVAAAMVTAWPDSVKRTGMQQSLRAAYTAAGKYDTTYCNIDPAAQQWTLSAPDALTDLGDFAQKLSTTSTDGQISAGAQALYAAVNDAIGERRIAENGIPYGLTPAATASWDFTGYSGISLYSDFARNKLPTPIGDTRNWQAYWYNNNKMAYNFTAQSQWDDLLNLFWQADDPYGQVKKVFCLPVLVLMPEEVGTGIAMTAITTPAVPPLTVGQPLHFTAQLLAESATERYTEVSFQLTMNNSSVFSETVVISKLLAAGEVVTVTTGNPWLPSTPGPATLTVTADPNDRLIEENETNNTLTQLYTIAAASQAGDCNGNMQLEASDLTATVFEIFDFDGNFWLDVPKGTFAGSYGCDANQDTHVDAGDLSCTAQLIFTPSVHCGS